MECGSLAAARAKSRPPLACGFSPYGGECGIDCLLKWDAASGFGPAVECGAEACERGADERSGGKVAKTETDIFPIPGTRSATRVEENVGAVDVTLNQTDSSPNGIRTSREAP